MRRLGTSSDVVYVDHRDSGVHGDGSSTSRRDSLVGLIRNVTFPVSQQHMPLQTQLPTANAPAEEPRESRQSQL
jgi:hypothetical protein